MKIFERMLDFLIASIMAAISIVIFLQVFFRYILRSPLGWSDEVARFLFIWLIFIGSYRILRRNGHIKIDLLFNKFPPHWKKILTVFVWLLISLLSIILIYYGLIYAKMFTTSYSASLQLPLGWLYLILPITGFLYLAACIEGILKVLFVKQKDGPK